MEKLALIPWLNLCLPVHERFISSTTSDRTRSSSSFTVNNGRVRVATIRAVKQNAKRPGILQLSGGVELHIRKDQIWSRAPVPDEVAVRSELTSNTKSK